METNRKALLWAFTLVGLALSLPSCEKSGSTGGREVVFSAASHAEGSEGQTRTAYSGDIVPSTSTSQKFERINWLNNDRILIASDVARTPAPGSASYAEYSIIGSSIEVSSNRLQSKAKINPVAAQGLQWGDGAGPYRFMGVYPSSNSVTINTGTGVVSGMSISDLLSLNPQATQGVETSTVNGKTTVTFTPDLSGAWMVADVRNVTEDSDVDLDFYPAFTAFEFHLGLVDGGNPVTLKSFTLSSARHPVNGSFTATSDANAAGFTYGNFPTASASNQATTVSFGSGSGIQINTNKLITFTILALPDTFNDLSISVTALNNNSQEFTRTMDLKDNSGFVRFDACKKHRILGLGMPDGDFRLIFDFQVDEWRAATDGPYDYTSPMPAKIKSVDPTYRRFDSADGFTTAQESTANYASAINSESSWENSSILVSYGYKNQEGYQGGEIVYVDDDEIQIDETHKYDGYRAAFSPVIALACNSDDSAVLRLVLDNPLFKFIKYTSAGATTANHRFSDSIDITDDLTYFSVVPVRQFKNDAAVHERVCTVSLLSVAEGTLHAMEFNKSGSDGFYRLPGDSAKQLRFFYMDPTAYATGGDLRNADGSHHTD